MTLIAHSNLPTFEKLKQEGQEVLDPKRAKTQDIRELHVGVFNMMPDAVLEATERQFLRLIGSSNRIVQFVVHLFSPKSIQRQGKAKEHVEKYYEDFGYLKTQGLDALIITGANPKQNDLSKEDFWQDFCDLTFWAEKNVTSTMCSCLATHGIFKLLFEEERIKLKERAWGVFSHILTNKHHPLVANINTKFDTPHSHVYEITEQQAIKNNVIVLANSEKVGLHLATTKDFKFIFSQGHPEYDSFSLLKEYKREYLKFKNKEISKEPVYPKNYFNENAKKILLNSQKSEIFTEEYLKQHLYNTWTDTGKAIFNNWLGLVYKITHKNRRIRLMENLDQENPLNIPD